MEDSEFISLSEKEMMALEVVVCMKDEEVKTLDPTQDREIINAVKRLMDLYLDIKNGFTLTFSDDYRRIKKYNICKR